MEHEEPALDEDEREDDEAAGEGKAEPQEPEQDDTASTTWDTDQHSDAPGPTGTG